MNTEASSPVMRPYVICHMISSLDGRLLVDHWSEHVEGSSLARITSTYEAVADRFDADAFAIGRSSMEEFDGVSTSTPHVGEVKRRPVHRASGAESPWAVVFDTSAKLRYAGPSVEGSPLLCVLSDAVTDDYLQILRERGISYVFAGTDGHDLTGALATLAKDFGIRRLLLEGGGITNGHFLRVDAIDEISLIVYPGLDGTAGNPAIFEAEAHELTDGLRQRWRHLATETLERGFVWLRYSVDRPSTS